MKRKVILGALAALFLGGGIFTAVNLTQKEQVSDLTLANIEAMTIIRDIDDEVSRGRWRTVGCGSQSMHDWKPYCCPDTDYANCPNNWGTRSDVCRLSLIFGC